MQHKTKSLFWFIKYGLWPWILLATIAATLEAYGLFWLLWIIWYGCAFVSYLGIVGTVIMVRELPRAKLIDG